MFDQETIAAVKTTAARMGVEEAALLAVLEVESAGRVYAVVNGRNEPLIRFEGHYFDRRLTGPARDQARSLGLANPRAGAVKNPAGQEPRWRTLNRAIEIDAVAALESTSFGVGQVMGAHWAWLGYASVGDLVNTARSGVAGQIELMARYIDKAGLVGALKRLDWSAFARGYNGPGFAANGYHTKIAAAYRRRAGTSAAPASDGMLRLGSKGARVRELQALLVRAGQSLVVDGDFGPATASAVRAFQSAMNLSVDGVAGPQTLRALDRYRQGVDDRPGDQAVTEVKEVRDGLAGGIGGGVAIEVARRAIEDATTQVGGIAGLEYVSAGLAVAAAALAVGGAIWAGVGLWRRRRTVEVPA